MPSLFDPLRLGDLTLPNRVVMAPLTRTRSPGHVPNALVAEYYRQRASAGLIISDSGGVQEEACLFRRPLLVVRDSTERPELLDGWCRLLGDEDPVTTMVQAWDVSAGWREQLATRDFPYRTDEVSSAIVAEINRRWPAHRHA